MSLALRCVESKGSLAGDTEEGGEGDVALRCCDLLTSVLKVLVPAMHDSPSRLCNFPSPCSLGSRSDNYLAAAISKFIPYLMAPLALPSVSFL